jgi:putative PEP-CTERM system TPR-repeat lipoprotein
VALLERAHAAAPSLVRVTVALGDLYLGTGNPQKAMDLANAVTGPAAGSTQILGLRASAYLALGQKKEALATDQDILKQDPNLVGVRRQLVALLIDAGDLESARNALAAGIAANPQNYQLYQDMILIDLKSTGIDAALATADRLQAENRDVPAIRALKGDTYLAANRLADAIAAYTDANNAAPSGQLVARIAAAMIRSGKTDDATKVLQVWLAAHPSDLAVAEQASEISIATGKLADARTTLEAMLKQRPHDAVVLNNLAWVYQQTGDGARAQSLARQAYVLSPGPQTADTLGWILTTSGNPGDGLPLLRQATSQSSVDPRILYHYAVALKDTGNRDEAKKNLQTVVASKGEFKEKTDAQKVLDDLAKGS